MNDPLTDFGELFIQEVRDRSLWAFEQTCSGKLKGPKNQELHQQIAALSDDARQVLRKVAYELVDRTLGNALNFFETHEDEWLIANPDEEIESLADLSDGLSGELYSDEGWIACFSKYDSSED